MAGATRDLDYHLRVTTSDGSESLTRDPYQYGPIMGEVDLHLFGEGQHWQIYEKFGAHLRTIGDAGGVYFAVWAPNAQRVSVVGDFNGWDGRVNPMHSRKMIAQLQAASASDKPILLTIESRLLDQLAERIASQDRSGTPQQRLQRLMHAYCVFSQEKPKLWNLLIEHRTITGGIGHNLPQEAPQAFAQAVVDIAAN